MIANASLLVTFIHVLPLRIASYQHFGLANSLKNATHNQPFISQQLLTNFNKANSKILKLLSTSDKWTLWNT
jgi:hypothetical protein